MLDVVAAVLLTAHLILIDLAMIGPLASAWFDWRGTRRLQPELGELGRRLAVWSLGSLVVGGVLGGALLALRYLDDARYFRALSAIPRDRLWFAGAEFVFSFLTLGAYVGFWRRWRKGRLWHRLLAVAASTNLMMHFPALFAVISIVSTRAAWAGRTLDRAEFRGLLVDGEVLSRVVHVWLAAVAVTGVAIVWLAFRTVRDEAVLRARFVRTGARLALAGIILQFPVGLWVTLAMPESAREPLLGGDAAATLFFLASVMLAMVLMHVLSALALSEPTARQAWRAAALLVTLMLLMVGTRVRLDRNLLRASNKRASEKGTVPFCSQGTAKSGQSPAILLDALRPRPAPVTDERTGPHAQQALASRGSSDSIEEPSTPAPLFATGSFR